MLVSITSWDWSEREMHASVSQREKYMFGCWDEMDDKQ